jgi:hypothetical protein
MRVSRTFDMKHTTMKHECTITTTTYNR